MDKCYLLSAVFTATCSLNAVCILQVCMREFITVACGNCDVCHRLNRLLIGFPCTLNASRNTCYFRCVVDTLKKNSTQLASQSFVCLGEHVHATSLSARVAKCWACCAGADRFCNNELPRGQAGTTPLGRVWSSLDQPQSRIAFVVGRYSQT